MWTLKEPLRTFQVCDSTEKKNPNKLQSILRSVNLTRQMEYFPNLLDLFHVSCDQLMKEEPELKR